MTKFIIKKNSKPNQIYFNETNTLYNYIQIWNILWIDETNQKILKNFKLLTTFKLFNINSKTSNLLTSLIRFSNLYIHLHTKSLFNFFLYLRNLSKKDTCLNLYKLYFTFTSTRLFINLLSWSGKNYTSLGVGLFLKFFKNKKSFKKNKLIKLLLVKYLRKLLIVSGIRNIYLYVQKKPLFFQELCKTLTTPLINSFINPLNSLSINESSSYKSQPFFIRYLFFKNTKAYNIIRLPRKGRLKRKIMRRIVKTNHISD
jgi:hypothetical protein